MSTLARITAQAVFSTPEGKVLVGDAVTAARTSVGRWSLTDDLDLIIQDHEALLLRGAQTINRAYMPALNNASSERQIEIGARMTLLQYTMMNMQEAPIYFLWSVFIDRETPETYLSDPDSISKAFAQLAERQSGADEIQQLRLMETWALAELARRGNGNFIYDDVPPYNGKIPRACEF